MTSYRPNHRSHRTETLPIPDALLAAGEPPKRYYDIAMRPRTSAITTTSRPGR